VRSHAQIPRRCRSGLICPALRPNFSPLNSTLDFGPVPSDLLPDHLQDLRLSRARQAWPAVRIRGRPSAGTACPTGVAVRYVRVETPGERRALARRCFACSALLRASAITKAKTKLKHPPADAGGSPSRSLPPLRSGRAAGPAVRNPGLTISRHSLHYGSR